MGQSWARRTIGHRGYPAGLAHIIHKRFCCASLLRGIRAFAMNRHEPCGLALPCQSAHFRTFDSRESSASCGICAQFLSGFLLTRCILVKLHSLCCVSIGQCVRSCGTAWYWSLIHMIVHKAYTSFVDTESGDPDVMLHDRRSLCGAFCSWRRNTLLDQAFQR